MDLDGLARRLGVVVKQHHGGEKGRYYGDGLISLRDDLGHINYRCTLTHELAHHILGHDPGRELWRVADCANHLGVSPSAWRNYSAQGRTPPPIANLDARTPLWDAEEVKTWRANRPGSPVPGAPGGQ